MGDMLVRISGLASRAGPLMEIDGSDVEVRHAMAYEKHYVVRWVKSEFGDGWSSECDVAFYHQPPSCIIAVCSGRLVGFACYESTYKNFFGPIGVVESERGRGIGKVLLLRSLHAMQALGYAYAIIGDARDSEFYRKTVEAMDITIQGTSYPERLK